MFASTSRVAVATIISPDACVIRANAAIIRRYEHVMGSDHEGIDDYVVPGRWDLLIDPRDSAAFAASYHGGTGPAICHDFGNDGRTDPSDLAVFATAYHGGVGRCGP